jgi:hypothetical protein
MRLRSRENSGISLFDAALAQLVEHLIRNEGVGGSNPSSGTSFLSYFHRFAHGGRALSRGGCFIFLWIVHHVDNG